MKTSTRAGLTAVLVVCHFLGLGSVVAASDSSQGEPERRDNPVENAIGNLEADYRKGDAQQEDIIDRALAPLDDTVSDINRDLNDGEADGAIPQTSD